MMIALSHFLLLIASPGLITLGRASPVPTSSASSTSSTSSTTLTSSTTSTSPLVNPTPSTTIPTSSFGSPGAYALNTTATTYDYDYDSSETPAPPLSPSPPLPRRSMINLPRWLSVPSIPSIPSMPSRPDVLRSTMGKLTNEKKYVLLGFSYTGQLAGTQHDKSLFPLAQLHLPGLPPSQPGEGEGDLMLLQEPSIQDPKGIYWKCFVVASLHPWTLALPQLKPHLTYSTPQFPATIHGVNLPLEVMRIPKSVWETRGKELGISSMCVNPRGKEVATLMVHKDMFAGNKMLSKGAQWEK
ncbi:hypothetical protein C8J55DRAFT_526198 [Lentinula edodes]|uniref:Uncharacterized protein n=1 Tax=Lentinula lateritia TaxID=40482 RepID=A0A9W9DFK4_9AGAR|nr:hypothetical protein C8J55DRAFT_526198 [Lentinula edodes]